MKDYKSSQEQFWASRFGDEYVERNRGSELLASNLAFFARVLARMPDVRSAIEFGANIGLNLQAIRLLAPGIELSAIEINQKAVKELEALGGISIYPMSVLDFTPDRQRDLVFTKGLLIHINPDELPRVYDLLYKTSKRFICIAEYYNPTPVSVTYRGHQDKLFKRDFAGELLDRFADLRLIDYGFLYHRDNVFPQGDITWFVMEKKNTYAHPVPG
jgi:pseudaminic acid biosynthesis-associated methylase